MWVWTCIVIKSSKLFTMWWISQTNLYSLFSFWFGLARNAHIRTFTRIHQFTLSYNRYERTNGNKIILNVLEKCTDEAYLKWRTKSLCEPIIFVAFSMEMLTKQQNSWCCATISITPEISSDTLKWLSKFDIFDNTMKEKSKKRERENERTFITNINGHRNIFGYICLSYRMNRTRNNLLCQVYPQHRLSEETKKSAIHPSTLNKTF